MSLISHLVEAAGTPEKQQKLRDGDMSLSLPTTWEKQQQTDVSFHYTRKQTSAPGKQQLAHQEKTQKDCKQTQALLLMWQHSTNSLSLSLIWNSEFSVTKTIPHESFSKCTNPTKWKTHGSVGTLSLSHTHTASKAESQQSSESFSSQKNELTVSSQQQQQHLQANMFPNVGEPNEN
jgi:hypothetical protein